MMRDTGEVMKRLSMVCLAVSAVLATLVAPASASDVHVVLDEAHVAGASEVLGLSLSEARALLSDPSQQRFVPVAVEEEDGARDRLLTEGTMSATSSWQAREAWRIRRYTNSFGNELFRCRHSKYWEFNGTSIRNVATTATANVSTLGRTGGWSFAAHDVRDEAWRTWNGNSRGSHWSHRQGRFSAGRESVSLWIEILARADGTRRNTSGCSRC